MKKSVPESRLFFLLLHQGCTIATAISMYTYDYIILKNSERNEIGYLIVSLIAMIGSIVSFIIFCRLEAALAKTRIKPRLIDRPYLEFLFVGAGVLLSILINLLQKVDIGDFSLAGLSVTIATVIYLIDTIIIATASSVYRRIVKKQIKTNSLIHKVWRIIQNYEYGKGFLEISRKAQEQAKIKEALDLIADGQLETRLDLRQFHGQEMEMAEAINRIQAGLKDTVEARIRDERMKADLITNVSHDIKTPLTSIVNYVELLRREELDNVNANNYIRIIDEKAQRLKTLTEDLVEVSKINSGNVKLDMQKIDFLELLYQTGGEFNERFERRNLTIVTKLPAAPVMVEADGRYLYRAIENLYTNAAKYALENTKVYVELYVEKKQAVFTIKNITKDHIPVSRTAYQDLTERFVRGEVSRTTEGSGLGLSIAKSIIELMGGKFKIRVEGELFLAQIIFPVVNSR
ncbi:MAG: sensor histidine kinase [Agathobacter sp.]